MTKVLIFTASFGDGHHQVARALVTAFHTRGVETIELDNFRDTNHMTARASELSYELSTAFFPWFYGASYRLTAKLPPNNPLWQAFALLSRASALRAVEHHRPDAVIQLFPDHALSHVGKRLSFKPYIGVVLTDYSVHSRWFHASVDTYYLPNDSLMDSAKRLARDGARLQVTGIPVKPAFAIEATPEPPTQRVPYILFATGGRGVFHGLDKVLEAVKRNMPTHHVYVLCGRNQGMYERVSRLNERWGGGVTPLGFQDNMASWLRHAAFAVMKSGGVTVTEALAAHCPMVLYRPLAGQETDNARFIHRISAGRRARNLTELDGALVFFSKEENLRAARAACVQTAMNDAAARVVNDLLAQLDVHRGDARSVSE